MDVGLIYCQIDDGLTVGGRSYASITLIRVVLNETEKSILQQDKLFTRVFKLEDSTIFQKSRW